MKNKYKEQIIKIKEQKGIVIDDEEENVKKIVLQDDEHGDNIDLN